MPKTAIDLKSLTDKEFMIHLSGQITSVCSMIGVTNVSFAEFRQENKETHNLLFEKIEKITDHELLREDNLAIKCSEHTDKINNKVNITTAVKVLICSIMLLTGLIAYVGVTRTMAAENRIHIMELKVLHSTESPHMQWTRDWIRKNNADIMRLGNKNKIFEENQDD